MALIVLAALILAPLAEIAVFIEVGGRIGLWSTLGLIVLTAVVGAIIIRLQGFAVAGRVRRQLEQNVLPLEDLFAGLCLLIAGALLLTPGFVTDALGALLLIPPVRGFLYRRLAARAERQRWHMEAEMRRRRQGSGEIIEDVPYEEVDPNAESDSPRDELPPPGGWGKR